MYKGTHLIIPDQVGDSFSCSSSDNPAKTAALQLYLQQENIIMIGWFHTHPQFHCFYSSIDLHNQFSMQKETDSFFGSVFSGIQKEVKSFRLNRFGMEKIRNCCNEPPVGEDNQSINVNSVPHFHQHEEMMYEEITDIVYNAQRQIIVKDFRI